MNRIIVDECPVVVLYYDQVLRFVRKDISGLGSNPMNLLDLTRVRKKPAKMKTYPENDITSW
jgi:peptide/nickel transport system substrate-binding protein